MTKAGMTKADRQAYTQLRQAWHKQAGRQAQAGMARTHTTVCCWCWCGHVRHKVFDVRPSKGQAAQARRAEDG